MKRCWDCDQDKPLDQFWLNRSSPDGRATYCIPCFKLRNRAASERRAAREGRQMREPSARPRDVPDDLRYCPSCQQVLPIEDFVRNRHTKSGVGAYCKPCQRAKVAESVKRRHGTTRHYHLSVRYALPAGLARRLGAQRLSIAVQGSNLGLWTNYRGLDPNVNTLDTGNSVTDTGVLPMPRIWQVRLDATY